MSRELLAWAAGAGPGDAPFTINLDSTICETYGTAKEGVRHYSYFGAWGYPALLTVPSKSVCFQSSHPCIPDLLVLIG